MSVHLAKTQISLESDQSTEYSLYTQWVSFTKYPSLLRADSEDSDQSELMLG